MNEARTRANRKWAQKNRERIKNLPPDERSLAMKKQYAYAKEWAKNNPEKINSYVRKSSMKKKYSLTSEEYDLLVASKHGLCAICRRPQSKGKRLIADLHPETKKFRGLLCKGCSLAIKHLQDVETVVKLIHFM